LILANSTGWRLHPLEGMLTRLNDDELLAVSGGDSE
jgi:hypothetical protein